MPENNTELQSATTGISWPYPKDNEHERLTARGVRAEVAAPLIGLRERTATQACRELDRSTVDDSDHGESGEESKFHWDENDSEYVDNHRWIDVRTDVTMLGVLNRGRTWGGTNATTLSYIARAARFLMADYGMSRFQRNAESASSLGQTAEPSPLFSCRHSASTLLHPPYSPGRIPTACHCDMLPFRRRRPSRSQQHTCMLCRLEDRLCTMIHGSISTFQLSQHSA